MLLQVAVTCKMYFGNQIIHINSELDFTQTLSTRLDWIPLSLWKRMK